MVTIIEIYSVKPPPPSSSRAPSPAPSPTSKPQRLGSSFVARQEEDLAERRRLQRRRAAAPHDPEGVMTFKPTILPASEVGLARFPCCRAKFCARRRGPANKAPRRQGLREAPCLAQRLAERGLARDRARFLSTPRDTRRLASPPPDRLASPPARRAAWREVPEPVVDASLQTEVESGSVAMSLCAAAHPLHTRFSNVLGASISEATTRPNPKVKAAIEYCAKWVSVHGKGFEAVIREKNEGNAAWTFLGAPRSAAGRYYTARLHWEKEQQQASSPRGSNDRVAGPAPYPRRKGKARKDSKAGNLARLSSPPPRRLEAGDGDGGGGGGGGSGRPWHTQLRSHRGAARLGSPDRGVLLGSPERAARLASPGRGAARRVARLGSPRRAASPSKVGLGRIVALHSFSSTRYTIFANIYSVPLFLKRQCDRTLIQGCGLRLRGALRAGGGGRAGLR
jgi:hypothetical protein